MVRYNLQVLFVNVDNREEPIWDEAWDEAHESEVRDRVLVPAAVQTSFVEGHVDLFSDAHHVEISGV